MTIFNYHISELFSGIHAGPVPGIVWLHIQILQRIFEYLNFIRNHWGPYCRQTDSDSRDRRSESRTPSSSGIQGRNPRFFDLTRSIVTSWCRGGRGLELHICPRCGSGGSVGINHRWIKDGGGLPPPACAGGVGGVRMLRNYEGWAVRP